MKSKAQEFLDVVEDSGFVDTDEIAEEVTEHLDSVLESIDMSFIKAEAHVDKDFLLIELSTDEDDEHMALMFEADGKKVTIVTEDDDSSVELELEESLMWINLFKQSNMYQAPDLIKILTGELLESVLAEGVFEEAEKDIAERMATVVRGGKKIKKKVRIGRAKIMTSKQKAALKKARRKAHRPGAKRARKISSRVRKRLKL